MNSFTFYLLDIVCWRAADLSDPKERMVEVVRWYLSSISASKKVTQFVNHWHIDSLNSWSQTDYGGPSIERPL